MTASIIIDKLMTILSTDPVSISIIDYWSVKLAMIRPMASIDLLLMILTSNPSIIDDVMIMKAKANWRIDIIIESNLFKH